MTRSHHSRALIIQRRSRLYVLVHRRNAPRSSRSSSGAVAVVDGFRSRFVSAAGLRLLLLPPRGRNPARRSRTGGVEIAQSCDRFSLHRDEIARGPVRSIVCIGVLSRATSSGALPDRDSGSIDGPHRALPYLAWILRFGFYRVLRARATLVDYGRDSRTVRDEAVRRIMIAELLISYQCPKARSVLSR